MSISQKVSNCLNKLWGDKENCDFTVQIGEVSIKCHSIILAACSPFFLGLLRSGMKEANEGRVVLQNVSASNIQLILKTLYTGEDVLSLDNFIEIWHAVDMLQFEFLVDLCETFATKNIKLENFSEIFSTANLFNSKLVLSSVKTFMIQNFESIYTSKRFLELSFDEMCFIVSSHALHFNSEHPVLELILNWAEYKIGVRVSKAVNNCNENNKKLKTLEPVSILSYASLKYTQLNSLEDKTTKLLTQTSIC
ncbi:kelch repeat and BTB domain-containing protein 3-like [Physella acuta]|uniref:kelch repeat and BTB domain-containing protein 3-like n=1 Tax=Physella acuta TaxID=109671 RepID=UPI0027DCACC2|nr:kelch repeat and BTB domain-containing protein 3-like [Physella acuta]